MSLPQQENDILSNQVKDDPRSCKRNLCNCVKKPKKIQDFNGFKLVEVLNFYQASLCNCIICVYNCEDHHSLDCTSAVHI